MSCSGLTSMSTDFCEKKCYATTSSGKLQSISMGNQMVTSEIRE